MNFKRILMPKVILAKNVVKAGPLEPFLSYFKCALDTTEYESSIST